MKISLFFFQLIIDSFSLRFLKSTCSRIKEGDCQNSKQLRWKNDSKGYWVPLWFGHVTLLNGGHLKNVNNPFILFYYTVKHLLDPRDLSIPEHLRGQHQAELPWPWIQVGCSPGFYSIPLFILTMSVTMLTVTSVVSLNI